MKGICTRISGICGKSGFLEVFSHKRLRVVLMGLSCELSDFPTSNRATLAAPPHAASVE